MFWKKSLLFTTALALLMFAGQASAQSVSLSLGEGGTDMVSGQGTNIALDVSIMGADDPVNALEIAFEFDQSLLTLNAPAGYIPTGGNTISLLSITKVPVPANLSVSFSTSADVTGKAFSIGVSRVTLDSNTIMPSASVSFNADGNGNGTGNGGDMPNYDNLSVSLTSGGQAEVNDVGGGAEIVVDVAVNGLMAKVTGAEITFKVDPAVATLTGVMPAAGMSKIEMDDMSVTLISVPVSLDGGGYGSATFTTNADVTAETMFSINIASFQVFTVGGMRVSAAAGDPVMVNAGPRPMLETESAEVQLPYDPSEAGETSVTAVNFDEGAEIKFEITGGAGFATEDGATTWKVSTGVPGDVTMVATDGEKTTAPLTIAFVNPPPYLEADNSDVIIPTGGEVTVTVQAISREGGEITYTISEQSGTATVNAVTDGATVMLTGSGVGSASVTLSATVGARTTDSITIMFWEMPTVSADNESVMVPQAVVPSESATVMADGFPPGSEVSFSVQVVEGLESYVTHSVDGHTVTVTSTGSAVVSVTASGAGVTTDPVMVTFSQDLPAAPASVVVQDQEGDNGHYVMVSFANSANHADVSQYRVYREMMVNTTTDADGNVVPTDTPVAKWVPWAVIDAMDNDDEEGMTRAVVPVTDATATRWGVAAEKGMDSAEITPAGKRVFSKESVQQLAQFLGLDPNRVVTEDELTLMFMPSADYIKSIIGDQKNVVFAALDPDLSVLIGGDLSVPQNIRTSGGPIVSSPITETEDMVAAVDDTAPAAVTDVTADADTGVLTWTVSADDGGMDVVMYRGHGITIPHVTGYLVRGGVTEDAMLDVGVVPAGTGTFQVPEELLQSLIDQGVPAVLVTIVALDGTNMTPSVPLIVELIPTRKPFVDADGGPVYIVKLDRHGAMTPLTVDFEDFVAFTMAFNTDETHENWRVFVQADLNDDKMVNFDDFILFFSSYGKEATGPAGKSLIPPPGVNEAAELSLRLGSDRVVVGETMFVDVSLANVQALMGYGFVLNYDAEKFEFVEAMPAAEDLLLSSGGETPLLRGWSPEAGQVHVMNAIVNGSEVSGDGDIVRLVFRVLRDFEDDARFEIAEGLVFDPSQLANPLAGGVLDIQTTPTEFALLQNFPNPFNPETTIGYELAESADVTLQIYNVVGQVVRTLIAAEPQSVGRYQVRWDGMDDRGMPVSSGIYFYQISAGKFQDVRKLMLLK